MSDISTAASNVIQFSFDGREVRTLLIDQQPWFVAADVCASLAIANVSLAVNGRADRESDGLDEDEKGIATVNTPSGSQEMLVVNESGLYALIFKSRKAEAKQFKKWVTAEVLPAIRKTGGYIHAPAMRPALTKEHWAAVSCEIDSLAGGWALSGDSKGWIYNQMRVVFQVARFQDVPDEQFETVMFMLRNMRESKFSFLAFLMEARTWFEKEVLGGGQPWTPTIKSKLTRQLKRQVILPPRVDWLALAQQVEGRVSA